VRERAQRRPGPAGRYRSFSWARYQALLQGGGAQSRRVPGEKLRRDAWRARAVGKAASTCGCPLIDRVFSFLLDRGGERGDEGSHVGGNRR
jgi:hypothetical protein